MLKKEEEDRMKNIILIAPPAAGKGTQSSLISAFYNIPHISAGDLLREAAINDPFIKSELAKGHLIDSSVTIKLLEDRILKPDCKDGYIFDGFPRSMEQAMLYDRLLQKLDIEFGIIIVLELSKEEALSRTLQRLTCTNCKAVYNKMVAKQKPLQEGICDKCGSVLTQREDDNAITFEKRYNTFLKETQPLISYYSEKYPIYFIKSVDSEVTFNQIKNIINVQELNNDSHQNSR